MGLFGGGDKKNKPKPDFSNVQSGLFRPGRRLADVGAHVSPPG